ncbi:MAG: MEDS domain-containing protein, partial [Dehalococcoidia bacterium]
MENELRNSGIDVIGEVPWGTHFCQFYKTREDLIDILVPYFKAGLENNEFCMWVTSEPLVADEAQGALRGAVEDFDEHLQQGQIEIIPYTEWYLLDGAFDDDRVLAGWVNKLGGALAKGYDGLRLTGNTFWLERNHWQAFTEYEAKVNDVIGQYHMLALCTYCLDQCNGAAVIDVVRNHQFALIKQENGWDMVESSIYKQAKQALRQSEQDLNRAQAVARTGSWRLDVRRSQLIWSDETYRIFGISKG